ncbi:MAG TPA: prolyl oligopeptidase family serine peptidase [Chitinophaga sp.]|uniref:alpha/beta hydrolase family protein n=1 Tax=Chitinophaga sp. TaxID=1869181 RepID=UPI002C7972D4|nr:prolyl oligopeptidase family serine peptidase [Chitinophaga sp.]HVI44404.1 prolyl oligopeptidase family serine peptidase [Chitinophaga sp.]
MKQPILCLLLTLTCICGLAQQQMKPLIDTSVYDKWPAADWRKSLSDDGRYFSYAIANRPPGSTTLILTSTDGGWKMEIRDCTDAAFTADSRFAIFRNNNDSLGIIRTGTNMISYFPHVISYKTTANWVAYQTSIPEKQLVIRQLKSNREEYFTGVEEYQFIDNDNMLLVQTAEKKDSSIQILNLLKLKNGKRTSIWRGRNTRRIVNDENGRQIAFLGEDTSSGTLSLWHYMLGKDSAVRIITDNSFTLDELSGFSKDGQYIQLSAKKILPVPKTRPDAVQLNIWSYSDEKLQPAQYKSLSTPATNMLLIKPSGNRVIPMATENEYLVNQQPQSYALICRRESDADNGEKNWNAASCFSYVLVSLKDGKHTTIIDKKQGDDGAAISSGEKYVVYYNSEEKNFFSYETATGIVRNITANVPSPDWMNLYRDDLTITPRGIAGWTTNDAALLLYDRYDIWRIDPRGEKAPFCITNGYGRTHKTIFFLGLNDNTENSIPEGTLLLNAFNTINKDNGYFRAGTDKATDPEALTMGPYIYQLIWNPYTPVNGFSPVKAKKADVFIVGRMSATESLNYFSTSDFRQFTPLSDIHPERNFNWYTTTLHTWKSPDNTDIQGILYKPENFDPQKKYPVILHYYERKSDALNAFITPESLANGCTINIPSYVSQGYLVFAPDIHYTAGDPMKSAYNAVVSAARYLSALPYVDASRMGIQGCSFGGLETNYIVTHTGMFAAACTASGLSNLISAYGDLIDNGYSMQSVFEDGGQIRMKATPWQIPEKYISNSPIFTVDKVTTPVLMMHTTNDGICRFTQALELFTALRRLGKKAWLLEYTEGNHGVFGKPATDFSIRMSQFFGHYLKGDAPPKWMTQGIPARLKGVDDGLSPDHTVQTPPAGGLLMEEQKTDVK